MAPGASNEAVLQTWAEGRAASPGERGLMLLRIAEPGLPEAEGGALTVGQRDAALLDLFERLFGATLPVLTDCPACAEALELDVPVAAIRAPAGQAGPLHLDMAGRRIAFRLPVAADLAVLGSGGTAGSGGMAHWLARRCAVPAGEVLDDHAVAALEAALDAAVLRCDPQAVVTLDFACPRCGRGWSARLDIVEFLWRRVDVFVRDLLEDVHLLASAYGWSERDILSLPSWRRRHYLERLGA